MPTLKQKTVPTSVESDVLTVKNLKILTLPPISFSLQAGQCLAVLGQSGIGKSLLLKSIADLVAPDGELYFGTRKRETMTGPQWRKKVRYCAAETGWWADHVADHFENPALVKKRMPEFGLKPGLLNAAVSVLSTGQRQRLGLLRSMIDKSPVLLLDEPTASLDEQNRDLIERVLKKALGQGAAICMVTHDQNQAKRLAQRILTLSPGKITLEKTS